MNKSKQERASDKNSVYCVMPRSSKPPDDVSEADQSGRVFCSLAICHDDHYDYHITLCVNKKYERSKTAVMKAAFPEMLRVTFCSQFQPHKSKASNR